MEGLLNQVSTLLSTVLSLLKGPLDLVSTTLNTVVGSLLGCLTCGGNGGGLLGLGLLGKRRRSAIKPHAF